MNLFEILRFVWTHPLNSHGKLSAIWRVLRWQIGSRLLPGAVALPFVESTNLFVTRGMTGATGNWYCGLHEVNEMAFALHYLRSADHFLDVGANIGSYTVLASGAVGARATAVEPIPVTFERLRSNVALNGLTGRVRCWQGGLGDSTTTLRFTSGLDTVNHVLAEGERLASIEVMVTTLDDLVGDDVPALVKIDVEGHELSVLKGAARAMTDQRLAAVIMEVNGSGARYGVDDDELISCMREYGFLPYGYDPFARRLSEGRPSGGNTVFVKDVDAVVSRIAAAPRYTLINGTI